MKKKNVQYIIVPFLGVNVYPPFFVGNCSRQKQKMSHFLSVKKTIETSLKEVYNSLLGGEWL
jgi:hypothetical protein